MLSFPFLWRGREPPCTTRTETFAGSLDYIWLTKQHFEVTAVMEMPYEIPTEDRLGSSKLKDLLPAIPNQWFPSDHLAVGCEVVLRQGRGHSDSGSE
jgi:mRNA deadenylase 3'-5' endonuclease subunit Ccr4